MIVTLVVRNGGFLVLAIRLVAVSDLPGLFSSLPRKLLLFSIPDLVALAHLHNIYGFLLSLFDFFPCLYT